jgi:outer membrane protein OmpA-like peptidoglycan-associated protein
MERPEKEELKKRLEFSEHKRVLLQKRLSRGSIEEDSTLWSFVDLMTLLLILFILEPVAFDPDQSKPDVVETEEEEPDEALEQFEQQVLQTVSEKVKNDFSIRWNQKRLLLPDFQPTLKRIAGFISSQKGYKVTVAGHTDDTPINNTRFPSNWELSAIRAVNVVKFMILHGVNPQRIATEGYSAYRPIQPNTTDDNRHANRRVEITLIKAQENEKSTEEKIALSARDASLKPSRTTNLPTYPKKRYHTARGYPF